MTTRSNRQRVARLEAHDAQQWADRVAANVVARFQARAATRRHVGELTAAIVFGQARPGTPPNVPARRVADVVRALEASPDVAIAARASLTDRYRCARAAMTWARAAADAITATPGEAPLDLPPLRLVR